MFAFPKPLTTRNDFAMASSDPKQRSLENKSLILYGVHEQTIAMSVNLSFVFVKGLMGRLLFLETNEIFACENNFSVMLSLKICATSSGFQTDTERVHLLPDKYKNGVK